MYVDQKYDAMKLTESVLPVSTVWVAQLLQCLQKLSYKRLLREPLISYSYGDAVYDKITSEKV